MSEAEKTEGKAVKSAKPVKKVEKNPEAKPAKKEVKPAKKAEKAGYGIQYLAEQLGKKTNLIRIQLRGNKIKKPGKSYTWATKSEADDVIKKLKAAA